MIGDTYIVERVYKLNNQGDIGGSSSPKYRQERGHAKKLNSCRGDFDFVSSRIEQLCSTPQGRAELAERRISNLPAVRAALQKETPGGWDRPLANTSSPFAMTLPNESHPSALVLSKGQSPLVVPTSFASASTPSNSVLRKWSNLSIVKNAAKGFREMSTNEAEDLLAQRIPSSLETTWEATQGKLVMGVVQATNTLLKPVTLPLKTTGVLLGAVAQEVCSGEPSPKICLKVSDVVNAVLHSSPVQKYIEGRNRAAASLEWNFGVPRFLTEHTLDDGMLVGGGVLLGRGGVFLRRELPKALAAPPKPRGSESLVLYDKLLTAHDLYKRGMVKEAGVMIRLRESTPLLPNAASSRFFYFDSFLKDCKVHTFSKQIPSNSGKGQILAHLPYMPLNSEEALFLVKNYTKGAYNALSPKIEPYSPANMFKSKNLDYVARTEAIVKEIQRFAQEQGYKHVYLAWDHTITAVATVLEANSIPVLEMADFANGLRAKVLPVVKIKVGE